MRSEPPVEIDAAQGPQVVPIAPRPAQGNVAPDTPLVFELVGDGAQAIAPEATSVVVNGEPAWQRQAALNGWSGAVQSRSEGALRYSLFPPEGFAYGDIASVEVTFALAQSGPPQTATYSFEVEPNPVCWNGPPSAFEQNLLEPLPIYALEQLRTRFLHTVMSPHDPRKAARRVFQMAFETEIGVSAAKLITILPEEKSAVVCEARRYLDVDTDMRTFSFLIDPAVDAVERAGFLPLSYVNLLRAHLATPYPRYRVCALAALLCVSVAYLIEDQR